MKIVSIYPNFANRGGAQDVVIQLAKALNSNEEAPIVMTSTPKTQIFSEYREGIEFIPFSFQNVIKLKTKDTIFISHHRKTTSLLVVLGKIVAGINIIHVAHNTFSNLKSFTFFPKHVIAVSNGVKQNLINYFHVPEGNITVIYNGIKDLRDAKTTTAMQNEHLNAGGGGNDVIKILIAGRICDAKQQVNIVRNTKGRLNNNIYCYFVGTGEDEEKLKSEIKDSHQYIYLGYKNIKDIIGNFDYVCLFSKNEGLGLTLIEGCMFGKPLITNDISPVTEINENGNTGFVFQDFNSMVSGLNSLPGPDTEKYKHLSVNARHKYEKNFQEHKMISAYKDYLKRYSMCL